MKKYLNIICTGEWDNYHRRNFISSVINEISDWSDVIILQAPLSFMIHIFTKFKKRFIPYLKGESKPQKINDGVYIFTPVIFSHSDLWLKFPLLGFIDSLLIKIQLNKFIKNKYKNSKIIFWVYIPNHIYLTNILRYDFLIYDSYDDNELDFNGCEIKKNKIINEKLLRKSDLTICVAKYTYDKFKNYSKNIIYLPNGNSYSKLKKNYDVKKAIELEKINRPIIGYLGNIRNWIDFSFIQYILDKHKDYFVVFIGLSLRSAKDDMKKLNKYENFMHIDFLSIDKIPNYLNFFNVGIIPFKINNFTSSVFPNKFFEYMAAEIPIVTTALPELDEYSRFVGYVKTKEEFCEYCEKAIKGDYTEIVKNYKDLAINNDWSNRAEKINEHLLKITKENEK